MCAVFVLHCETDRHEFSDDCMVLSLPLRLSPLCRDTFTDVFCLSYCIRQSHISHLLDLVGLSNIYCRLNPISSTSLLFHLRRTTKVTEGSYNYCPRLRTFLCMHYSSISQLKLARIPTYYFNAVHRLLTILASFPAYYILMNMRPA